MENKLIQVVSATPCLKMGDVKFVELSKNLANSGEEKEIAMIDERRRSASESKKVDGGGELY